MIKKLFNVFMISLISLGNFFILPVKSIKAAGSAIRINEVAPSESSGRDWIEFYVAEGGDYGGYVMRERMTEIKVFSSDFNLEEGDYVVLHLSQTETETDENNMVGKGENGYWDLYSSDSDLTGTDNVITIEDRGGYVVDALCFSNMDNSLTYSPSFRNAVLNSILTNQWNAPAGIEDSDYISISADWSGGKNGYSLGRDIDSTDTNDEDVAANDWSLYEYQTMGFANRENLEPEILEIEANPNSFILGEEDSILFTIKISDEDGLSDLESVNIDLTELSGGIENIYDSEVLDGIYNYEYSLPEDIEPGTYNAYFNVLDSAGNEADNADNNVEIEIIEPTYSDQIIINEVLPNPEGDDSVGEFIELYNKSSEIVDLENWKVSDISKTYIISSDDFTSTEILDGGYFVIYGGKSSIFLNNGGETVNLYQPNSNLLDTITYSESAPEGQSFNLFGNVWQWSMEPTPGSENKIVLENHNPKIVLGNNIEAEVNEKIILDGSKSSDPDGDEISFEWDFGDGNKGSGSKTTHAYTKAGSYTVKLNVNDGRGGEDSDTLKIKIIELKVESETISDSDSDSDSDSSSNKDTDSEKNISGPFSKDIIITEVLPNPEGSDTVDRGEFIEIYNKGKSDINLESWQVDDIDGGSKPHTITEKTIKAGEYSVFYRGETKLSLNNSDEKVRLIYPDGEVASEIYYEESAKEGYAYAINSENNFEWTDTPTPGEENIISNKNEEDENEEASSEENNTTNEESDNTSNTTADSEKNSEQSENNDLSVISIKEARNKEKNSEVKVKGIVISEPGLFSKKTFYIQDATSGIQVYFSKEDFPKLELGDEVTVLGKTSESGNEKKINISAKEDVQILSHKSAPQPKEIKTGDLKEDYEGQLVKIAGEIVKTSGNVFYLNDGSKEAKVSINQNTGIKKPEIKKGDKITILGIESETSSGYRVLPRYQNDIRDGDGSILAGIKNGIIGSIPEAGANIIWLFMFASFITFYVYLPKLVYEIKNN